MSNCPACNVENPEKAKFCRDCGASLASASAPIAEDWTCAHCQKINAANKKFCPDCGTPKGAATAAASSSGEDAVVLETPVQLTTPQPIPPQEEVTAAPLPPVMKVPEAEPTLPPPTFVAKPKRKLPVWFWLMGALFLVVAAIVAVVYNKTSNQKEAPASQALDATEGVASQLGQLNGVVDSSQQPTAPAAITPPAIEKPASKEVAPVAAAPEQPVETVASKKTVTKITNTRSISEGEPVGNEDSSDTIKTQNTVIKERTKNSVDELKAIKEKMLQDIKNSGG